jgi:hypothetical protein
MAEEEAEGAAAVLEEQAGYSDDRWGERQEARDEERTRGRGMRKERMSSDDEGEMTGVALYPALSLFNHLYVSAPLCTRALSCAVRVQTALTHPLNQVCPMRWGGQTNANGSVQQVRLARRSGTVLGRLNGVCPWRIE